MADESQTSSMHRLEAALRRLEGAVVRRPAAASDAAELRAEYEALQRRHTQLEARAQEALDSLDRLLGRLEPR